MAGMNFTPTSEPFNHSDRVGSNTDNANARLKMGCEDVARASRQAILEANGTEGAANAASSAAVLAYASAVSSVGVVASNLNGDQRSAEGIRGLPSASYVQNATTFAFAVFLKEGDDARGHQLAGARAATSVEWLDASLVDRIAITIAGVAGGAAAARFMASAPAPKEKVK